MSPRRNALVLRDGLRIEQLAVAPLAPQHVRVALTVAGICRTDLAVAGGTLEVQRPRVLGHEAAGRIVAVGPGVSPGRVGQQVGIDPRAADQGFLGVSVDGAFATSIDLPLAQAIRVAPDVSSHRAAYLEPTAAALGAVGLMAHARSPAILGNNRIAALTSLLATAQRIEHHWHREPSTLQTHDLIVESDPSLIDSAIDAIEPRGTIVLKSRPTKAVSIPFARIVGKDVSVRGVAYGSFEDAANLLADPLIDFEGLFGDTHDLGAFERAFDDAGSGESHKVFLRLEAG